MGMTHPKWNGYTTCSPNQATKCLYWLSKHHSRALTYSWLHWTQKKHLVSNLFLNSLYELPCAFVNGLFTANIWCCHGFTPELYIHQKSYNTAHSETRQTFFTEHFWQSQSYQQHLGQWQSSQHLPHPKWLKIALQVPSWFQPAWAGIQN